MATLPATIGDREILGPLLIPSRAAPSRIAALHTLAGRFILIWLAVRTLAWTLVMTARSNPPLDVVEWLCWGRHWQLGYHKHPPLAAWVAEIGWMLTPGSFLGIYALGYLAIALALWCVWNLARQVLPLRAALAATLCLDGLVFLGPGAGEFNNQVLLVGFWALLIERGYLAWRDDRLRDWVLMGVALGLALLCKYTVVFLLVPLVGWWLASRAALAPGVSRLSRLGIVALVSGAIFLPHFVWLVQHDFITLHYASRRAQSGPGSPGVVLSLGSFLGSQIARLLPMLVILAAVIGNRGRRRHLPNTAARSYVLAAVLGPIALHLLLGLIPGTQLRDIWGMPLWSFAPVALLLVLGTRSTGRAWRRFRVGWVAVGLGALAVVVVIQVLGWPARSSPRRIEFPGAALAREITSRYQQRHGCAPAIVAGDWRLAGNVCCHSPDRPILYSSQEPAYAGLDLAREHGDARWSCAPAPATSPWTSDADLNRRGGVLVWCAVAYGEDLPACLQARFPVAQGQRALALPWTSSGQKRVRIGWAMLPPRLPPESLDFNPAAP